MLNSLSKKALENKIMRFLLGGIGMKAISFGLNYVLVVLLTLPPSPSYIFILCLDFILGYIVNRHFVFQANKSLSYKKTLIQFLITGASFRLMNWLIYMAFLTYMDMYLLLAQLIATAIVLVFKYFIYNSTLLLYIST